MGRPGVVTSVASAASRRGKLLAASRPRRVAIAPSTARRTSFAMAPTFGRSSAGNAPMPRRIAVSPPFFPRTSSSWPRGPPCRGAPAAAAVAARPQRLEVGGQLGEIHRACVPQRSWSGNHEPSSLGNRVRELEPRLRVVGLAPHRRVQTRVLERDRSVAGEHLEQPQVVLVELAEAELREQDAPITRWP